MEPVQRRAPATIAVAFTGDMFGPQVYRNWQLQVLEVVRRCPQHVFIFLTKAGEQLPQFNPWPQNAWVGVSITGVREEVDCYNLDALMHTNAAVKWISFEPLLGPYRGRLDGVDWIVVGAQTGAHRRQPEEWWVQDLLNRAAYHHIPVWLKDNLRLSLPQYRDLPEAKQE